LFKKFFTLSKSLFGYGVSKPWLVLNGFSKKVLGLLCPAFIQALSSSLPEFLSDFITIIRLELDRTGKPLICATVTAGFREKV